MSASGHRPSALESTVSSPLARAPRFSPPSSRAVSPIRRPLSERSESLSNSYAGPTIRLIEDPEKKEEVYSKNPFPSQSSHILPPRKVPGYTFERKGSHVSDRVAKIEASQDLGQALVPKPLRPKKVRHSTSTSNSDADTIVAPSFSPLSSRFSQGTTTLSSFTPEATLINEKDFELLEEHPSSRKKSTIRAVTLSPSTSAEALLDSGNALTPKASAASLASTASTESSVPDIVVPKRRSANVAVSPYLEQQSTPPTGSNHQKQASPNYISHRPDSQASALSFAHTDHSYYGDRPRSASQPKPEVHAARTASVTSGVKVNYPVVRAPSASSLWASSQDQIPPITSRMTDRGQTHNWSSQLSTIASESDRGSQSFDRSSHSYQRSSQSIERGPYGRFNEPISYPYNARPTAHDEYPGYGRSFVPRRRQTIGSEVSSDNVSTNLTDASSIPVPRPLFSPTISAGRSSESDERHDTVAPLQSPPLRLKRSFLRRSASDSRSTTSSRPSSSQSDMSTFIANTIPAWARVYYRRGERSSLGAPDSESSGSIRQLTSQSGRTNTPSDGNMPFGIYRPRNRPREGDDRGSFYDDAFEQDVYVVGGPRRYMVDRLSPRLMKDQRSQARLSAWKAPSFDENFGAALFNRQNRQIVLFSLGFICPFAWMLASVLPLPPDPAEYDAAAPTDIEQHFDQHFGPVIDKSFQKANWWRNLNRIMSAVGTLLIGIIIALAVLASKIS